MKTVLLNLLLVIIAALTCAWTFNQLNDEDFYRLKLSPEGKWYYQ